MVGIDLIEKYELRGEINEKLLQLYNEIWNEYDKKIKDERISYPYFLSVDESCFNTKCKIMVFGQSTNCWGGEFNDNYKASPCRMMKLYGRFVNDYGGNKTPFWQFFSDIKRKFSYSDVSFIANNLVKIGGKGSGYNESFNKIAEENNLIKRECDILMPDIVVFLSGYDFHYNKIIVNTFGKDYTTEIVDNDKRIEQLHFAGSEMLFLRTYHPRYINCQSKEKKIWREYVDFFSHKIENYL